MNKKQKLESIPDLNEILLTTEETNKNEQADTSNDKALNDQIPNNERKSDTDTTLGRTLTDEDIRLGGKPPLQTILSLSSGPLISQFTGAFYGVVNTIWISKALHDDGLAAISTYQNFDTIGRSFASFLQVSATTKIASLFGEGKKSEAAQVLVDLLRFSIVCGIISPLLFIPLSKVCIKWFGTDENITELGFHYIVPNLCLSIVPCLFLVGCGCLQAEGRSWLFSIAQVAALILDMIVFCPLFLIVFKIGIAGAAIATGLAEFVPGIIILLLFFAGKFGVHPKYSQLLGKFSPHSFEALKLGLAQFVLQLSFCIPGIVVRKLFGLAAESPAVFNDVMAAFNTFNRIWYIEGAVPNAINIAFIPAASYAYGAGRYMRIVWLLIHSLWIAVVWASLSMVLTIGFPIPVAKIFSNTSEYLKWSEKLIRNGNYATCICEIPIIITSLLQAMKRGNQATFLTLSTQLIPLPLIALALYFSNKHDIARIQFCYPIQITLSVIISIPFAVVALKKIINSHKNLKNDNINNNEENELESIKPSESHEQLLGENSQQQEVKQQTQEKQESIISHNSTDQFKDPEMP